MSPLTITTKKFVFVWQFLIFAISPGYSQYIRTVLSNEKINGHVLALTYISCIVKDTSIVDSNSIVTKYDLKGKATAIDEYYGKTLTKADTASWTHTDLHDQYDSSGDKIIMTYGNNKYTDTLRDNKKGQEITHCKYIAFGLLMQQAT